MRAMKRWLWIFSCLFFTLPAMADDALRQPLEGVYNAWRSAMIQRDFASWQRVTAEHRVMEVRNRIVSEQRPFPASVFELPAAPPTLSGLRFLDVTRNGRTANMSYFGRVNFGVGGSPTDNLLVLSFTQSQRGWQYDRANFVNLSALPDVRRELAAGDLRYLRETAEIRPTGVVPETPIAVPPAQHIAKVYVFCPGREVQVQVNRVSRHRFSNDQEAELVMGGARNGQNEVQFSIRPIEGAPANPAMAIRVYLLSTIEGVKPIKAFEYLVREGETPRPSGTMHFDVDAQTAARLRGR